METTLLPKNKLNRARDLFIFSCYTGLSYIDLINLTLANICIGIDGEHWIKTARQKTEIPVNVPLLPQAFKLIEKYRDDPVVSNQRRLLPYVSNQKVNAYLKEMAIICKIEKYLNFHLARHTFSTTVTLANGVPLETVSREASKMIQQVMKPEETDNYINHELLKKKRKRKRHYHHL